MGYSRHTPRGNVHRRKRISRPNGGAYVPSFFIRHSISPENSLEGALENIGAEIGKNIPGGLRLAAPGKTSLTMFEQRHFIKAARDAEMVPDGENVEEGVRSLFELLSIDECLHPPLGKVALCGNNATRVGVELRGWDGAANIIKRSGLASETLPETKYPLDFLAWEVGQSVNTAVDFFDDGTAPNLKRMMNRNPHITIGSIPGKWSDDRKVDLLSGIGELLPEFVGLNSATIGFSLRRGEMTILNN